MADERILYLSSGGASSLTISMISDTGIGYTLPQGHSFNSFVIAPYLGGVAKVTVTSASVSSSTITLSLTSAQTATLSAGKYVGSIVFLSGTNPNAYVFSDPFVVVVTSTPTPS